MYIIINALDSRRSTGMPIAAKMIYEALRAAGVPCYCPRWLNWLFRTVNDALPKPLVLPLRFIIVQATPFFFFRHRLIFASHNAPIWKTNRHVVVIHDFIALLFPFQARLQTLSVLLLLPRVVKSASSQIFISEAVKQQATRWGLVGASDFRSAVVPSLSPSLVVSENENIMPWGERKEQPSLVMIGARYRHKNLRIVIALAEQNLSWFKARGVRIFLVGLDPSLRSDPRIKDLIGIGVLVVIEYATDAEIKKLLCSGCALLYPSHCEGQGLPPLEAMVRGCVPLCSDLPELYESCGEAAYYYPDTDAKALYDCVREVIDADVPWHAEWRAKVLRQMNRYDLSRVGGMWADFLSGAFPV